MEHTVEMQKRHRAHPDGEFTIKPRVVRDQEEESLSFFLIVFQRDDVQAQKKDISGL